MDALTLPVLAVVAGVISFSSPCCLPLVPGYLSYVSALPVSELTEREARRATLRAALLFVAGFTVVFTALGSSFALMGSVLLRNVPVITRLSGVLTVAMGLAMLGLIRIPLLYREGRFAMAKVQAGPRGAFPMGMAFAFGWAPCIGPVLATILATAAATQTVGWGAFLLAMYSLGLGIPFIGIAVGLQRARRSMAWLTRHGRQIEAAGGFCWSESARCSSPVSGAGSSSRSSATSPSSGGRRSEPVRPFGILFADCRRWAGDPYTM